MTHSQHLDIDREQRTQEKISEQFSAIPESIKSIISFDVSDKKFGLKLTFY